ncbi:MAG: CvpA family protein [Abyssibacter sp.]|uniref:CvpA family protein n=1 Tax=Abyssibacter sp. TaxID=2320200 RepID=UPI00321A6AEE
MVWVDYLILAIVGVSALISLFRGFIKEACSLTTWIVAFWVSMRFASPVAALFEPYISAPSARLGLGYVLLFLLVLILGAIATHFLTELVRKTYFAGTDRMVGVIFGIGRGLIIVTVLVMAAQIFTPVQQDPWWQASAFLHHFEAMADWVRGLLPEDWSQSVIERAVTPQGGE